MTLKKPIEIMGRQYKRALNCVLEACDLIRTGKVPLNELIVSKSLRQPVNSYRSLFPHVIAAIQLIQKGKRLKSGETINFIYVNAEHRTPFRRVAPAEALDGASKHYDHDKYIEMIMDVAETILGVFGFKRENLGFEVKAKSFIEELKRQRNTEILAELENLR